MKSKNILTHISLIICFLALFSPFIIGNVYAERFFKKHSTWYEKIPANTPTAANSANYVARLVESAAGGGDSLGYVTDDWSVPIYHATGSDPTYTITVTGSSNTVNTVNAFAYNLNVPIGTDFKQSAYGDIGYRDGHMVVISEDGLTAWDFFRANVDTSPPSAKIIKRWDLTTDGIAQPWPSVCWDTPECEKWLSCRVTPMPLLHGIVTYDEVKSGVIEHALSFSHGGTTGGTPLGYNPSVYPSDQNRNGSGVHDHQWSPLLGQRYQLDPTLDVDDPADWGGKALSVGEKVIAKALQEYGMIFVENSGTYNSDLFLEELTFDATRDWSDAEVNILGSGKIKFRDFRLIDPLMPPFDSQTRTVSAPKGVRLRSRP